MRAALLLLLLGCGEAETLPLDPSPAAPKPPPSSRADAGFPSDASSPLPRADIVPSVIDFGGVGVGLSTERIILAVNRNDEDTVVVVLSNLDAYRVVPAEIEVPANTRREITVRFEPRHAGIFDEQLELDACSGGCIERVRLVGWAE